MPTFSPPPPGTAWEFDPWVPEHVREQTIAWAENEHPVTPEAYAAAQAGGGFPPWGVRPEIDACASRGGTWRPDPGAETKAGLGGRCELPSGEVCEALAFLRGACPAPVEPDPVEPDPVDPFPTDPTDPPPATGDPAGWLILIAAIALLNR